MLNVLGQPSSGPLSIARPIPPRDRTKMDRVLEYLLGDGPQHKYALICQKCASHNGMALKEEFEYIGKFYMYMKMFSYLYKERLVPCCLTQLKRLSVQGVGHKFLIMTIYM